MPAAIGVAGSTYSVIIQNFGWAMGYNVSALPLAASGLLDPLVAAVAMGLSSLIVVLNSLRLTRLGRSGLAGVTDPAVHARPPGVAVSVAAPGGAVRRPHRGQPAGVAGPRPVAPAEPALHHHGGLPHGGSAEMYLDPGRRRASTSST